MNIFELEPTHEELAAFTGKTLLTIRQNKFQNSHAREYDVLSWKINKLINSLRGVDKANVKKMLELEPTNTELAEFIGITKQAIGKAKSMKDKGYAYKNYLLKWQVEKIKGIL